LFDAMERSLAIGDFSRLTGLSADTLRYYERVGLINPIERAPGGQRRYSSDDAAWVEFLTRLRATGMSIARMRRFAELRRAGAETVRERRELLEAHRCDVETRQTLLADNLGVIAAKIEHYRTLEEIDGDRSGRDPLPPRPGQAR
jgi:DNA-binding transcriptional MerR regulator